MAHGYCSDYCFHICVKEQQLHDLKDEARKTRHNFNYVFDWIKEVQKENCDLIERVGCLEDRIRRLEQNNDVKHRRIG